MHGGRFAVTPRRHFVAAPRGGVKSLSSQQCALAVVGTIFLVSTAFALYDYRDVSRRQVGLPGGGLSVSVREQAVGSSLRGGEFEQPEPEPARKPPPPSAAEAAAERAEDLRDRLLESEAALAACQATQASVLQANTARAAEAEATAELEREVARLRGIIAELDAKVRGRQQLEQNAVAGGGVWGDAQQQQQQQQEEEVAPEPEVVRDEPTRPKQPPAAVPPAAGQHEPRLPEQGPADGSSAAGGGDIAPSAGHGEDRDGGHGNGGEAEGDAPPLMVIGVPSVRRSNDEDYLPRTLAYIAEQTAAFDAHGEASAGAWVAGSDAPGPIPLRVRVIVMDNSRSSAESFRPPHAAFEAALTKYCGATRTRVTATQLRGLAPDACGELALGPHTLWLRPSSLFVFVRNGKPHAADGTDEGTPNVPGYRVRQQTRDVTDLMDVALQLYGKVAVQAEAAGAGPEAGGCCTSGAAGAGTPATGLLSTLAPGSATQPLRMTYYMFQEDDFRLCPRGLEALAYLQARATAGHGDWNAIRISYGLNGAILRGYDVPALITHYSEHLARRPPDHLLVEWFAGERPHTEAVKAGRVHVGFRYNVLEHFGFSSSLRSMTSPVYAQCYELLDSRTVFEIEAYNPQQCGHTDIWPCWSPVESQLPGFGPNPQTVATFDSRQPPVTTIDFQHIHDTSPSVQTWAR